MRKKKNVVNTDLEEAISLLLKTVMNDPTATLTDKAKVLDRALKWEAIKLKAEDDAWGAGFMQDSEDDS